MRNFALCLVFAVSLALTACAAGSDLNFNAQAGDSSSTSDGGAKYSVQTGALKMAQDPTTSMWDIPQTCTDINDANCNAAGPGQRLICDPDKLCRHYIADDGFNYDPMNLVDPDASVNTFKWVPCTSEDDCNNVVPYPYPGQNLTATCIHTKNAETQTTSGVCFYAYKKCEVALNSPCYAEGVNLCSNGNCTCSAVPLAAAITEICDAGNYDENCNGQVNEEGALGATKFFLDGDKDSYGSSGAPSKMLCGATNDYTATVGGDCNDSAASVNPGASESCNNVDDDCNNKVDDGLTFTDYYADSDKDGYGAGDPTNACSKPTGTVTNNTDCNDNDAAVHAPQPYFVDSDKDGYGSTTPADLCAASAPAGFSVNNTDCNDNDAAVHAPQPYYVDGDKDGYGSTTSALVCSATATSGYSVNKLDCNDSAASVNPGASESCNNVDDDCNNKVDDGLTFTDYYADSDKDGYGAGNANNACKQPTGTVTNNTDCNDSDAAVHAPQPYFVDSDKDGYGSTTPADLCAAVTPSGYSGNNTDCNDSDAAVHAPQPYFVDNDKDGFGSTTSALVCSATATSGYSVNKLDCNDGDKLINPDAVDICNQVDDNCDGKLDIAADGSPACDTNCPIAKTINPAVGLNDWTTVNMSDFAANNIDTYQCGAQAKPVPIKYSGNEAALVPNCPKGQTFSAVTNTPGVNLMLLKGDCAPTSGTTVGPAKCMAFGANSVKGGVVGSYYVLADGLTSKSFGIQFSCQPAK